MQVIDDIEKVKREVMADRHRGDDVWKLHCMGHSPSEIAKELRLDVDVVHDHIVKIWRLENPNAR